MFGTRLFRRLLFAPLWSELVLVFFPAGMLPWWRDSASNVTLLLLIVTNVSVFVIAGIIVWLALHER